MCYQQMEIYTCTAEIVAVGLEDYLTVLCGCSIAEKGQDGRYRAMCGAPHRLVEFPVYCEEAKKTGKAGTNCPSFKLEWIYTPDPHNRCCHEHSSTSPTQAEETDAVLAQERRRFSEDYSRESLRARAAYMENVSVSESRPRRPRERLSVAPRDRGESPWVAHAGAGGSWLPEPENAEFLQSLWDHGNLGSRNEGE